MTQGKGKKNGHKKAEEPLPASVSYAYDAAGNRINETADNKTIDYHYNAANQLLQMGETRYSYDANGNRIGKQDQEGLSRYHYNQDNFLAGFDDPEGKTTDYGYDAMNRRIYKATGEKDITSFLYDGLEVLQEISGENSQKIVSYYRANGRIVTRQEYNVSQGNDNYQHRPEGQQLFYTYDGLGSVVALSNHQGKEKTRYHYDAFGKVIDGDLTENQYTFTGRQLDPESGLYHFHFRQYDSQAGVWTTPDPIGVLGGVNLYGYSRNNPVNLRDRLGLDDVPGTFDDGGTVNSSGHDITVVDMDDRETQTVHGCGGNSSYGNDWDFAVDGDKVTKIGPNVIGYGEDGTVTNLGWDKPGTKYDPRPATPEEIDDVNSILNDPSHTTRPSDPDPCMDYDGFDDDGIDESTPIGDFDDSESTDIA